jgi:hypothetical protein
MNRSFKSMAAFLVGAIFLASCSRPAAYFQPIPRETFTTIVPTIPVEISTPLAVAEKPATASIGEAKAAIDQVEALVSRDRKLAENKAVQKRLNRIRTLLAESSKNPASTEVKAVEKQNLLERLAVKKINKKISKKLAPHNPDQVMASKDILTAGAVLVLGGLLLILLTSGAGFVIGLAALAVGLVMLLIGLL